MNELMAQDPPQPDSIGQGALGGDLNATQHRIEQSISPGRAPGDAMKCIFCMEDDDNRFSGEVTKFLTDFPIRLFEDL